MIVERAKETAGMLGAGGLGILGALSVMGLPAHAQGGAGVIEAVTGMPKIEGMGGAALIGVLVYLLQAATRERVAEAKEYAQLIRDQAAAHSQQMQQERAETFAQMEHLRQATNEGQMRLLQFYERLATPEPPARR